MPASVNEKPHVDIYTFTEVKKRKNYTDSGISYPSPENMDFWNGNPPEEIIISTGSIRKAIMAIQLMNGFVFTSYDGDGKGGKKRAKPMSSPIDLQTYFDDNIHNGDGQLPEGEKVLLGYFHDIPVYAENGNGESKSNFPIEQAEKKALTLAKKYNGRDVIIIATDTVNHPLGLDEPLGKPMNEEKFPQRESYDDEDSYLGAVNDFKKIYRDTYYKPGTQLLHSNGIAVVRTNKTLDETPLLLSDETVLNITIGDQIIKIFEDCAGGGGFQQYIRNWFENLDKQIESKKLFAMISEKFQEITDELWVLAENGLIARDSKTVKEAGEKLEFLKEAKKTFSAWVVMCQISGMPWAVVDSLIGELIKIERKFENLEVVEIKDGEIVEVRRLHNIQQSMIN